MSKWILNWNLRSHMKKLPGRYCSPLCWRVYAPRSSLCAGGLASGSPDSRDRRLEVCLVCPLLLQSIPRSKCHSLAICARGETLSSWVKLTVAWKSVRNLYEKMFETIPWFWFWKKGDNWMSNLLIISTIEAALKWLPSKTSSIVHHGLKKPNWCGTVHLDSRI